MKQFETKEAFLLDALEYYCEDPNGRRCFKDDNVCAYSPKTVHKETTEGCLIGRVIDPELAFTMDKNNYGGISSERSYSSIPSWLQLFGQEFLDFCQTLHDRRTNWDIENNKMTDGGKSMLKNIIVQFKLPEDQFKKFLN